MGSSAEWTANWRVKLAKKAEKQLERLPLDRHALIVSSLKEMAQDPFRGDVKPLHGKKWAGYYRKRVGQYRLIFVPFRNENEIEVSAIVPRSEKSYR